MLVIHHQLFQQKIIQMARRKKIVILPHLCDADGDIEKKWWVEYSMRDTESGEIPGLFRGVPDGLEICGDFFAQLEVVVCFHNLLSLWKQK